MRHTDQTLCATLVPALPEETWGNSVQESCIGGVDNGVGRLLRWYTHFWIGSCNYSPQISLQYVVEKIEAREDNFVMAMVGEQVVSKRGR